MSERLKTQLRKRLWLLPLLLLIVSVVLGLVRPFGWDELEHIHASYLVYTGSVPYRDFFEHHHPLLWYQNSVVFYITSNHAAALWILRGLAILVGILNLGMVYFISGLYLKEKLSKVLAVLFAGTSIVFLSNGMEIRPDNLMILFVLISYYFIVRYNASFITKELIIAGLSLSIAILFLQKAILFIPIFNLLLLFQFEGFSQTLRKLLIFNSALLFPCIIFLVGILASGMWSTYFFLNWTLNSRFDDVFSIQRTFEMLTLKNSLFFIFLGFATVYYVINIKKLLKDKALRSLFTTIVLFGITLITVTRSPYSQYLLPLVFFGSILIVKMLEQTSNQMIRHAISFCVLFLSALPLYFYNSYQINGYTAVQDVRQVITAKQKITPPERVNVQKELMIFEDKHPYYWFSMEGQRTISALQKDGRVPETIPLIDGDSKDP